MSKIWNCLNHNRVTELYCKTCKTYVCPECVTTHYKDGHTPALIHVLDYAPTVTLPTLDRLIERTNKEDSKVNLQVTDFISTMNGFLPKLKDLLKSRMEAIALLQSLAHQMENYTVPVKQQLFVDRIRQGLTLDKKKLEEALTKKDLQTVVNLTMKVIAEGKTTGGEAKDKAIINNVKKTIIGLNDTNVYKSILNYLQTLNFKCQHLRLNQSITEWKCDRKYLTTKMTLSEDGLTYGNQAGNGYPAIIGDTPLDSGIMAFEVIPAGLCCKGKEGFGLIEFNKYKSKFAADSVTPTVYDDMIGLFYDGTVKGMSILVGPSLKNGEKYIVKADMATLELTITGPNCKVRGTLKADTTYVPCFSCGCRANKLTIKPIEAYND